MKIEELEVLDPFKYEFAWKIIKTLDNGGKPDYFNVYDKKFKKVYTLFYKKKQLLNLDEALKRKKTSELKKISSSLFSLKTKDRKRLIYEIKKKIMDKNWKETDKFYLKIQ